MNEDSTFARQWADEIARTDKPADAAKLPSTALAALRAWHRFSDEAAFRFAEAKRRAAESIRKVDTAIRDASPAIGRTLLAASQVTAVTYAEHLNARYREADKVLRERGWWALSSWSDEELATYADLARSLNQRDFARALCEQYRSEDGDLLRALVGTWADEPVIRLRTRIVRDALADHLAGRYRVSIPTLLPTLEGSVAGAFGIGRRMKVPPELERLLDVFEGIDELALEVAVGSLSQLYGNVNFDTTSPLSPSLNRHLILHGRTVRYGTEANSLKVFFHLDELHTQLSAKRRLEEGRAAPLQQRPIRMANELVKLLGVPDEMIAASRRMAPIIETRIELSRRSGGQAAPLADANSQVGGGQPQ